jgi:hypothetical protein
VQTFVVADASINNLRQSKTRIAEDRLSWPRGKSRRCRAFAAPECFDFSEFHKSPVQSVFIAMSKASATQAGRGG